MRGLVLDSYRELLDRRLLWVFVFITIVGGLIIAASRNMTINVQMHGFDEQDAIREMVSDTFIKGFDGFLALLLFLSVMGSSGSVPAMLERGRAEYFIAKPLSRTQLLMTKYLSLWLVFGGVIIVSGLICYLMIAFMHDLWEPRIIAMFAGYLASLAVWQVITTLAAVLSGSTMMAIVTAFLVWIAQLVLSARESIKQLIASDLGDIIIDGLYWLLPKPDSITDIGTLLTTGSAPDSWMPALSTLAVTAALLIVALVTFNRKDY